LVVDDNDIMRRIINNTLMNWQVAPSLASNGKMAMEMLSKNVYDVVLMDIMMPGMDGYETTREIRALDGAYFRNLPIFACSASPDIGRIMECGMNGQIAKSPIDRQEMHMKISPYLK